MRAPAPPGEPQIPRSPGMDSRNFDKNCFRALLAPLGRLLGAPKVLFFAFGGLPERSWDPPGANLARKRPPEAKKRPPGSILGPLWLRKTMIFGLVVFASRAAVGVTGFLHISDTPLLSIYCPLRCPRKTRECLATHKNQLFFIVFRCYLPCRTRARQAKRRRESQPKP